MPRKKISLYDHSTIAHDIHSSIYILKGDLFVISKAYGASNNHTTQLNKILNRLHRLRNTMANKFLKEYPETEDTPTANPYRGRGYSE